MTSCLELEAAHPFLYEVPSLACIPEERERERGQVNEETEVSFLASETQF